MADGGQIALKPPKAVHKPHKHESAKLHVSGQARYVDDIPEARDLLHLAFGQSAKAHAKVKALDLTAVRSSPGVVAVYTAADIPGENDVSPVAGDDLLMASDTVTYVGQPLFIVAGETYQAARIAARKASVEYEELPHLVTIEDAKQTGSKIEDSQHMRRGDAANALPKAPHRLQNSFSFGGQDHFYLEGQVALAQPNGEGGIHVVSSTQHPSEVQHLVAKVLGLQDADVVIEVRRMGGAFGGKETQAAPFAAACALVSMKTGRPSKFRCDRDDDMVLTGKRHDFVGAYDVGFDDDGRITAIELELSSRCGATTDLSPAINDRSMFHADNCYWLPDVAITSHRLKTNTVSNTAFRGFGGPQGMMVIERVMDDIAAQLGLDPLTVRQRNLYGTETNNVTPYGMEIEDNVAGELIAQLADQANYQSRKQAIDRFNAENRVLKKGLALTPVRFGISFTTKHLNQGGALVLVYADGTVLLNHGGTEMGQGLFVKVAQIVADVFAIPLEQIRVSSTRTDKVPNTSATAASSGTDINGMAPFNAATTIRERLTTVAAQHYGVAEDKIEFTPDGVGTALERMSFAELCRLAHFNRVSLAANG
ncbi:MAG: xanthine dehydrogenase molybdopterin binding subunit, partial [Pseudomonadota bacterium]